MQPLSRHRIRLQMLSFAALLTAILIGATLASFAAWNAAAHLGTLEETICAGLALVAGVMALVRYYTRKASVFLLLGSGFIGAGFLDRYRAAVTSSFFTAWSKPVLSGLAGWSGVTSQVLLAALACGVLIHGRNVSGSPGAGSRKALIYSLATAWTLSSFLLFILFPAGASSTESPAGWIAGLLLAGAAAAYLRRAEWKPAGFEYWLVLSLIALAAGQLVSQTGSFRVLDALHVSGPLVKIIGYLLVLTGLFVSLHSAFAHGTEYATRLEEANQSLQEQMEERLRAEESLEKARDEMELLVNERTAALARTNQELEEEIAERRRAEQALRASEDRFRMAAENASDAIWEWDLSRSEIQVFRSPADAGRDLLTFAQSIEEFEDRLHPDDRARVVAAIERLRQHGEPFREEYRAVDKNGAVIHRSTRGTIVRDDGGKPSKCIGVTSDITARKLNEEALWHLAAIIESSDTAIMSKALDGTVLTWNAAAERVFGYSLNEVKPDGALLAGPDRRHEDAGFLEQIRKGECVQDIETVRIRKDGFPIHVVITVSPVRDPSGSIIGGSWVISDITERKARERQLAQAQKLESIGQLAAGIAHEINTPVQYLGDNIRFLQDSFQSLDRIFQGLSDPAPSIDGGGFATRFAQLAKEEELEYLQSEVPVCLAQSLDGVERIANIVRAMKEFSHPGPLDKMASDLNRGIDSTIQVSRNEWKYVADVVTDFDSELPLVECVAGEINQVVLNLVVNAAHAIADVVKDHPERRGTITVSTRRQGDSAEIRVSDTGTGIPEAARARIFDPFFTTKAVGKGTGQGLAIAHSVIVQKHGGAIHFETETGVGTTFIVQLPLGVAA